MILTSWRRNEIRHTCEKVTENDQEVMRVKDELDVLQTKTERSTA